MRILRRKLHKYLGERKHYRSNKLRVKHFLQVPGTVRDENLTEKYLFRREENFLDQIERKKRKKNSIIYRCLKLMKILQGKLGKYLVI